VRIWTLGVAFSFGYQWHNWYGGTLLDATVLFSQGRTWENPKHRSDVLIASGLRLAYNWEFAPHWSVVPHAEGLFALNRITMQLDGHDAYKPRACSAGSD